MRHAKFIFSVTLITFFGLFFSLSSHAFSSLKIDFENRELKLLDFNIGPVSIDGTFAFSIDKGNDNDAIVYKCDGQQIRVAFLNNITKKPLKNKVFEWVKFKLIHRNNTLYLNYFSSPEFILQGKYDIGQDEVFFDVAINSSQFLSMPGKIMIDAKLWGKLNSLSASGRLSIEKGVYKGRPFDRARFEFVGKLPLLNLTDSKIVLNNGNVYELDGVLNLADFGNPFHDAQVISRKVTLDGWEIYSQQEDNVGLKKSVDDNVDFHIDTYETDDQERHTALELRHKLQENDVLKFRVQEGKTIVGFERKKEF
ncbi:MAG: hypothetical protein ABH872_05490 [Candidatus Omnitrophota bacterium]